MIRQVLVNLVSNALKFTTPKDSAVIEVGHFVAEPGAIYVNDNGVEFDGRYVDKLFGVFQRLHSAEKFEAPVSVSPSSNVSSRSTVVGSGQKGG